jgi:hypothetical protein
MGEATKDALAVIGLFTVIILGAASTVILYTHWQDKRRAAQRRRADTQAIRVGTPEAPLYGLPSVQRRHFEAWLAQVEKEAYNAPYPRLWAIEGGKSREQEPPTSA